MSITPLPKCEQCEKTLNRGEEFICQYCKGIFCIEHRLPPKHNCPMIALWHVKPSPNKTKSKSEELIDKLRGKRRRK